MPEFVDDLIPKHPETSFTETRHYRRDGWTPERKRQFLERFAECGVIVEACEAAGMSARSAYNLRDRDPLFAAGWEAATVMARPRLADEVWSRSMNGVVERIYRDGLVVAERHRYDNRLTMAALTRLDARIDRAEEQGAAHLQLVARWDDYLAALAEDRREDGLALLAAPAGPGPEAEVHENPRDRELHELRGLEALESDMESDTPIEDEDWHDVWEEKDGSWWTDYPPPAGFEGEEMGEYGEDDDYRRTLAPEEQAVIDADLAAEKAEARARGEAQRAAYFGIDAPEPQILPGSGNVEAARAPVNGAPRNEHVPEVEAGASTSADASAVAPPEDAPGPSPSERPSSAPVHPGPPAKASFASASRLWDALPHPPGAPGP